ncbi:MAG: glycosyltransferase family 4 protein [Oceanidesulfovibrio sp.]
MLCIGGACFSVTLLSLKYFMRKAPEWGFMCHPGGHSCHENSVPLLGGAAIYCAFFLAFALFFLVFKKWPPDFTYPDTRALLSLFIGSTWIAFLGTMDDKLNLGWKLKLLGELLGVAILLVGGHTIKNASIPYFGLVDFGWLGYVIFALGLLIITNAVNLIDGLDGLAGGICFFAALVSGVIGLFKEDIFVAVIGFGMAGGLLAFLRYNFPPAKVFMGDGGSLMLGFLLSALATSSVATTVGQRSGMFTMILVPFLPFGIALLDVSFSIVRRGVSGRCIFHPDTDHIHHRLMNVLGRPRRVVGVLYLFSALLSAITLTMVLGPQHDFYRLYVVCMGVVALGLVVMLLRLYTREGLPQILGNRPHMKFLVSFSDFMQRRLLRASSRDEVLALLERGVSDLGFDSVRIVKDGAEHSRWDNPNKLHPEAPREHREWPLGQGLEIHWSMPTHHSDSFQSYLCLTWSQLLKAASLRLEKLDSDT